MTVNFGDHTITLSPQGADVILAWESPTRWTGTPNLIYSVTGFSGRCDFTHYSFGNVFAGPMGDITFTGTPTAIEAHFWVRQNLTVGTLTLPAPCASWAVYFDGQSYAPSAVLTVGDLIANGSATYQLSMEPYAYSPYPVILSKASGVVNLTYCTLVDMPATGGAFFLALTSNGCIDGGGNTGWYFDAVLSDAPPPASLILSGHAPTWWFASVNINTGHLVLTPHVPSQMSGQGVILNAAHLELSAHPPAFGILFSIINQAHLIITPHFPVCFEMPHVTIPAQHIILSAYAPVWGHISQPIPLASLILSKHNPFHSWSISANQRVSLQNVYLCVLTGDADGVADLIIPMSSFQSTMRDGDPSYLACVIPNSIDYIAAIQARTHGDIVVRKGYRFSDGTTQTEEICRVDYESLQIDRGGRSDSATISGHKTTSSTSPKNINLAEVSYYGLQANGKRTYRAAPDLFLRVGDTAIYGAESITVGQISYQASTRQAIMQVTEA